MIPLNENIHCPKYLGVYISERVTQKLFNNTEWMGIENPGYDFIANGKRKLDVKGSSICKDGNWHYLIRKNKKAEYFMLFAYDNIFNLSIMHIWLIKADDLSKHRKKFNELIGLGISNTEKSLKWYKKYELSQEKLIDANIICQTLKNEPFDIWKYG